MFDYDFASVMLEMRQKMEDNSLPVRNVGEMSEKMSEKVLGLIKVDSTITTAILAKELEVSTKTIERAIKALKNENRIERIGGDRGGYWRIIG